MAQYGCVSCDVYVPLLSVIPTGAALLFLHAAFRRAGPRSRGIMASHASIPHSMENATLTHHASQVLASLVWPTSCPDPSTAVCKRRRPPLGINNACKYVPILITIVICYMYIMANVSGVLYTGVTNYLERRVEDHISEFRICGATDNRAAKCPPP